MAYVVSFAGQKGGTGKSMLAQSFAVDAAQNGAKVTLADLDVGQRSSFEWSQARLANDIQPPIRVVVVDPDKHQKDFGIKHAEKGADLLIVDAPGWSDEKTKLLAGYSDLMVLPTGASLADMRPTIRLMHELTEKGINKEQICTALCRVKSAGEIKFAREYIQQAGYDTLPGMLRDMPTYRALQNEGRAAIEADSKNMRQEANELITSVKHSLEAVQNPTIKKPERFEMQPERYVHKQEETQKNKDTIKAQLQKQRDKSKSRGRTR